MSEQPKLDERKGGTSASNALADSLCQGRHLACRNLPDNTSDDATFGTTVHAALAKGSDEGLTVEQQDIYESCQLIESKLVDQCFGPDKAKAKVFTEQRFWVRIDTKDGHGRYEHSGKADKVYRHESRGLIVEYKTLAGEQQESAENMQLRDNVVLAARSLVLQEVMAVVIQPLVTHSPTPVLYDKESIKQAEEDMFARVRASNNPASLRVAGEVQCKFCKFKPQCPEYAAWSVSLLPATVSLPDSPVAVWTPEQMALFCDRKGAVQKWMDDCEQAIKDALEGNPDAVPGYCLKPGAIKESVSNPQELFNRFSAEGGTLELYMSCVSIAKGKLETAVRDVTKAKGKSLASKVDKLLEGLTTSKQNSPSIAKKKGGV